MEEVERMERRERDKQERAKMSLIQNNEPEPEMPSLFSAPFRVSLLFISSNLIRINHLIWNFLVYFLANESNGERSANTIEFRRFSMLEAINWTRFYTWVTPGWSKLDTNKVSTFIRAVAEHSTTEFILCTTSIPYAAAISVSDSVECTTSATTITISVRTITPSEIG